MAKKQVVKELVLKFNKPKFQVGQKAKRSREYGDPPRPSGKLVGVRGDVSYQYLFESPDGSRIWCAERLFVGGRR